MSVKGRNLTCDIPDIHTNPINRFFSRGVSRLLVPSCIWLPTSPIFTLFQTSKVPTLSSIMGYRQLLYCALEAHRHSPVRWTHFPLFNGTVGVRHRVNLTDWEFQSETLLLNKVVDWRLYEQSTLTKHSFALALLFTTCPSLLQLGLLVGLLLPLEQLPSLKRCFCSPLLHRASSRYQVMKVQLVTRVDKKKVYV